MATSICNVLVVSMPAFTDTTAAAARTFTAPRAMRIFDLKVLQTAGVVQAAATVTVSNGANLCITKTLPNPTDLDDLLRLGQNAADTVDDAQMLVAAGGTIVFATNIANTFRAFLYAYPL